MKTITIAVLAAVALLPAASFAQTAPATPATPGNPATPATPATPAVPAQPGAPTDRDDKTPKVPITYLGVETSELPSVVADQLGLPKGFGLVVDYVVPDGPAATAGVQQNDILKMFNDQILTEPDQLSKLIRSNPEGTSVTLTVLRKGAETKLTARLGKREVRQRRGHGRHWGGPHLGDLGENMEKLSEKLGKMQFSGPDADRIRADVERAQRDAGRVARDDARRVQREAARAAREAGREAREAAREARAEARATARAARGFRFNYGEDGRLKTTRIDMDKAQIVYHDDKGELKIENVHGKKVLTAKDPQGRLVFSGPVETPEELGKLPADVRQRYDQLEQKDIPALKPVINGESEKNVGPTDLEAENDNDNEDDDGSDEEAGEVLQVLQPEPETKRFPHRRLGINTILI